jgi:hypothetical protein
VCYLDLVLHAIVLARTAIAPDTRAYLARRTSDEKVDRGVAGTLSDVDSGSV